MKTGDCALPRQRGDSAATSALVRTVSGPITGDERDGVRSFKGIPFAAPPVAELRWKPPQPPAPWTEPRACITFGPACPQIGKDLYGPVGETNEDCLYLNVWTPAKDADAKKPVLFWIHGGGFMFGSGGKACYEGVEFSKRLGAEDLKAMRAKSTDEVLAAVKPGGGRVGEGTQEHLCIDGHVLRESLQKTIAGGRHYNVPLLGGTTKDEDRLFLAGLQAVLKPVAAIQAKTFSYEFRRTPEYARAKKLGCFHGVELPYLFRYFPRCCSSTRTTSGSPT